MTWVPGPSTSIKVDQVIDEVVEVEPAISHTDIASVMPVGNVDVVVR
jgi:hypothetical protein